MSDPTEIPAGPGGQSIASRYGTDRRRRPVVGIVLGGLLALALLAWAVWAGWAQGREPLEADVSSYRVVSTHEIQVQLTAHFRDDGVQGSCLVRATAADHTVVGELNVTADELRGDSGRWMPIRTERRATTATVVRCD